MTVNGVASNGVGFTVRAPGPEISGLNPTSGEVGTSVTIMGANFGSGGSVTFAGTGANTTSWSGTSITAPVPEGARTGAVVVTVEGVASNGVGFTVGEDIRPLRLLCASSVSEPSGSARYIFAYVGSGNEPAEDLTVRLAYSGTATHETDYTAPETLTIPAGRTSGTMSPRLAVVDDRVYEGEERIELTATAEGYEAATCTITLEDDETAPVPAISGLNPAAGPVGTSVTITGSNFGENRGTSRVSFAGTAAEPSSWSETSIVAPVPEGATSGAVVVTVGSEASAGVPFRVTGVRVSPTELTIEEGGEGSYTVVLDSEPASAVTVSMFTPAGTDLSVDILPVFTASNWNRPQTVTVTAGEDEDQEDERVTLTHRTASADAGYHDLTVDGVEVTITDNDAGAGVRVTPTELTIEEGGEGIYTVVLNTEPAAGVTVTATAGGDLTVDPAVLAFTALNWDRPQEVRVTAGEDEDASDETESITHGVTSTDSGYIGVVVDEVRVTIADDEGAGGPGVGEELTVSTTRLRITEGNMGSYTVVLNREPASGVTVAVSAGGDLTVDPAVLTFTATDWNTPQEVMVTAGEDADLADEVESITHTITRTSSTSGSAVRGGAVRQAAFALASAAPAPTREYIYLGGRLVAIEAGGVVSEASVVVTIDDDDDPDTLGVPALTESLTLFAGHTGAYTLELGSEPTAEVRITVSVAPDSGVSVRPTALSFTAADWDTPKWVTVSVGAGANPGTVIISHAATSADSRYRGIEIADVRVVTPRRTGLLPVFPPEGELTADPNPCLIPAGQTTCSTTLSWTSTNTTAIQIRKITTGINQIVVTVTDQNANSEQSPSRGWVEVAGIGLTPSPFYLYDYSDGRRGKELATVPVNGVRGGVAGPTLNCSASPASIKVGGSTTLSWWTTNATDLTIEDEDGNIVFTAGATEVASGSHVVTPAATTDYRLTATGDAGMVIHCREKITLWEAPVIDLFRADPEIIDRGEVTRLFWGTTNTTNVSIDQGIGYMPVADGGYLDVAPAQRTPYRLTATNPAWYNGDGVTASVTVTVNRTQGPSITCSPRNRDMAQVERAMLSWETTGATDLTINDGTSTVTVAPADVAMGTHWVTPQGTTIYTLTATDQNNQTSTCPITLRIWDAPVISFTATPNVIARGETSTLKWEVANATEVNISGGFRDPRTGEIRMEETREPRYEPISGSRVVSPHRTRIYNITASNPVYHPFYEGSVDSSVTVAVTSGQAPITCSVSPSDIRAGGTATLSWETAGLSNVVLTSWSRNSQPQTVGSNGSMQVSPQRNYTYHLKGEANGTEYHCWANVAVWGRPVVDYFTASPASIGQGQSTRLGWSSRHATGVSINPDPGGVAPGASGFRDVSPNTDTTYTLTASNPAWSGNGATSAAVPVTVGGVGGVSCTLSASDSDIKPDESTTLRWTSLNADRLILNPGNIDVTNDADRSRAVTPGTVGVHPYRLSATGAGGSGTCQTVVTVWARPSVTLEADRTTINEGQPLTLRWTSHNADRLILNPGNIDVTNDADRSRVVRPLEGRRTYTLTASNPGWTGGDSTTASVTVTVRPEPPGSISASPNPCTIEPGDDDCTTTLRWSATGTTGLLVRVSRDGADSRVVSSSGASGSTSPTWIEEGSSYRFSLYDYMDRVQGALLRSVTVTGRRSGQPTCDSFTASPANICSGGSSTLRWQTTNADSVSISPDPGGGRPGTSGSRSVSPTRTTQYTLTASNDHGTDRCMATVNVWDPPEASISASRTTINEGQPFTLSWSSSNAASVRIDPGIGAVTPNVSGSRTLRPSQGRHTYTITASGPTQSPCSNATDSVTVTVRPRPTGEIWGDPNPCTIPEGRNSCTSTIKWRSQGTTGTLVHVSHLTRAFASSGATGSQDASWIQEAPAHTYTFYLYDYMDRVQGAELDRVTIDVQRPPLPMISVLNPTSGSVGDAVRLTWTSFGGSQGTSTLQGAELDRVTVTGQRPPRPWINDLSPPDGVVGTAVTISGVNFGNTGSVTFNATYGSPSSWSDTSISVEVPWGATSGPVVVRANGQDSNSVQFLVTQLQKEDPECEDPEDCPEDEEAGEDEGGEDPPPDP